jgi:hypothetical protein
VRALRFLAVLPYGVLICGVFLVDAWRSGVKGAMWNFGQNALDWCSWFWTGELDRLGNTA